MKRIICLVLLAVFVSCTAPLVPAYAVEATVLNGKNRAAHTQSIAVFTNGSTVAPSGAYDIGFLAAQHTWMMDFTGSPGTVSIILQGTIDGANWFNLDTYTGTADTMRHVVNKPVRKIRVDIDALDTGSVTVKTIHGSN